jgi:predicted anti-sigma-YlaC factor YlaD
MSEKKFSAEFATSACGQYEAALEDCLNGELAEADSAKVTEHLKTCAGCATASAEAEVSARLLRVGEPAADPGPGFSRMVMARIRVEMEKREEKSIWRPFVALAWKLSATAALALVMLVTFDARRHGNLETQTQNEFAVIAANEAPELLSDEARLPSNRDETLILLAEDHNAKH